MTLSSPCQVGLLHASLETSSLRAAYSPPISIANAAALPKRCASRIAAPRHRARSLRRHPPSHPAPAVMRNALEMSRLLQNAAAGAQGQSGDALRVGLTEMRTDLSADAGVLSLDDIVAACGPSVGALKPYQVVGVSFLTLLYKNDIPGAILADEMVSPAMLPFPTNAVLGASALG